MCYFFIICAFALIYVFCIVPNGIWLYLITYFNLVSGYRKLLWRCFKQFWRPHKCVYICRKYHTSLKPLWDRRMSNTIRCSWFPLRQDLLFLWFSLPQPSYKSTKLQSTKVANYVKGHNILKQVDEISWKHWKR